MPEVPVPPEFPEKLTLVQPTPEHVVTRIPVVPATPTTPFVPLRMQSASGVSIEIKYAGFYLRVAAAFVDGLLLTGVNAILLVILGKGTLVVVVGLVIAYSYYVLMLTLRQATLGKMMVGLYVERAAGERIDFAHALVREISKILSAVILGIGFLMVIWTEKKQGLHDKIAGTVVIEREPTKSKTLWKVLGGIVTWILPVIFVMGFVTAIVLSSLNAARIKGADAAVRAHLSAVTAQAELYFEASKRGYKGFCTSPEAVSELTAASSGGTTAGSPSYLCNDSASAYAASAPLTNSGYGCVDSTGMPASENFSDPLPPGATSCGTPTPAS